MLLLGWIGLPWSQAESVTRGRDDDLATRNMASVPRLGTRWEDLPVPESVGQEGDAPLEEVEEGHFVAHFDSDGVHNGRIA